MSSTAVLVVVAASLVGAFAKSVTGMGYPLIAVPLVALATGIEDAVVVVAAPNLVMNGILCWQTRTGREGARDLAPLLVGGAAGAVVGVALLVSIPEEPLLALLALTIVVFLHQAFTAAAPRPSSSPSPWAPGVGVLAGIMQGAVGVSGPVVAAWLHRYRLPPATYVFSITAVFGLSGLAQFVLLVAAGRVTTDRLGVSALALVPVLLTVPVGRRIRARMAVRSFEHAVLAVLALSVVALVVRVVS